MAETVHVLTIDTGYDLNVQGVYLDSERAIKELDAIYARLTVKQEYSSINKYDEYPLQGYDLTDAGGSVTELRLQFDVEVTV